jgi:prepilin-type N-terminal cleavage/methylation domain-containing protein
MNSINDKRRAFTLIELVVAISLLAVVIFFTASIFRVAISSYRVAGAQAEVMQKLRAITNQLNSDFKGLRKDAPLFIWFQKGPNGNADPSRYDQIMFFADGDFQSTRLYDGTPKKIPSNTGTPIVSNVARIQYCQAMVYSPTPIPKYYDPMQQQGIDDPNRFLNINHRTLARRQHLLTADTDIFVWPDYANFSGTFVSPNFLLPSNETYEHDSLSLSQWQALTTIPANNEQIITVCFGNRPQINFLNNTGFYTLMSEGVGNMSIQWSYTPSPLLKPPGTIFWWPSIDPDGNGDVEDSDFAFMSNRNQFGIYFNMAPPDPAYGYAPSGAGSEWLGAPPFQKFLATFYPTALKFTFTLYDSKGVFKDGQTFTHIVYLGD